MTATFSTRLRDHYQQAPEQTALTLLYAKAPDQTLTYRELVNGAAGYAQALAQHGIQPGEIVILILQHGQALVEAFFGAALHGAIPSIMPFLTEKLAPEQYRRSLAALFEISAPAAVITYPEFLAEVQAAAGSASSLRLVLDSSTIQPLAAVDFAALCGFERRPDEIVLLQHSSGTTGLQKGVALSHQAVFNQLESYGRALQLHATDVVVSWLPLYHDMGLIAGFLLPILNRLPLVLMSPFDWVRAPYRLLQAVSKYRGTLSWLPNFAYNFCAQKIRERDLEGVDLSSWRAVSNCSEPMVWKSHQMFSERFQPYGLRPEALTTCYAMAENVFAVTQGGIDAPVTVDRVSQRGFLIERVARPPQADEETLPLLSCGRPIDNTEVKIVDDHRHDLPERQVGEVALRSNCMLTGYYHRADLTTKAFNHGWYLTGDLGYMADGEVYVTGRKKDLIIVGGKNVYPQDLEALANETPGVHPGRVVAFGVYNEEMGTEDVVMVAEVEDAASLADPQAAQNIADDLRRRVTRGSDIALRHVQIVPRGWLLKTSSGKVARSANREKYLQSRA
jgi:acyl-CoA synthetase (AMP-forming)/AMP-acid ligase II